MGKLKYYIEFRNGTNLLAPPREQYLEVRILGNNAGVPKVRMYEEGTIAPAFDAMTYNSSGNYYIKIYAGFVGGKTYQVDYTDSTIVSAKLFEIDVRNNVPGAYKGNI